MKYIVKYWNDEVVILGEVISDKEYKEIVASKVFIFRLVRIIKQNNGEKLGSEIYVEITNNCEMFDNFENALERYKMMIL